jgi:DNA-binding NarL/FixJ family response regulator
MPASVMVIEDHPRMQQLICQVVGTHEALSLMGAVASAEEALERVQTMLPDLFLVDISLPGMDGIQLVRRLRDQYASCRYLMVSGHTTKDYVAAAKEAGADGFVPKDRPERLVPAIDAVLSGEPYWPSDSP